jgi:hypothetical protein
MRIPAVVDETTAAAEVLFTYVVGIGEIVGISLSLLSRLK